MDDPEQLRAEEQRLIVEVAQNPKDHQLYSDLARVYMRLRVYTDAVEALQQALKLEPGNEQYLRRLERAKRKRDEATVAG
jgi:cytochrome c-type biogenesis protein CcmH/NrfG